MPGDGTSPKLPAVVLSAFEHFPTTWVVARLPSRVAERLTPSVAPSRHGQRRIRARALGRTWLQWPVGVLGALAPRSRDSDRAKKGRLILVKDPLPRLGC
jgi:hypothetical protein